MRGLARLGLVVFGLLLSVVLLEGALQVAAHVAKARVRAGQPGAAGAGDLRILCLGDSNTYGLYLERHESYPARLEALWNATREAPTLEVLNLGMPGTNSSWLVRESDRLLRTFEPDVVILLVGANDFWTRPYPLDEGSPAAGGILRHSRLARAWYMARRGHAAGVLEVERSEGRELDRPLAGEDLRDAAEGGFEARFGGEAFAMRYAPAAEGERGDAASLRANLRTLAGRVRERGAEPVLLTYPSRTFFYGHTNGILRRAARELQVPLVDLDARFRPLCPEEPCPEWLFSDGHPKASGYRLVAETIVEWLSASSLATAP